jgi:DNA-binding Lrp family transcriptional regulator
VRIFCEMAFVDPSYEEFEERHPSAADLGKKLGLDTKTVRVRVNRMEESGFIKYYQATPNLALFGMRVVSLFRFEALNLPTKNAIVNHLHGVPRLVEASDYLGPFLTGSMAGSTERRQGTGLTT